MLATTLLAPRAPWPLSDRPLWKGVEHVPVTDALELHSDGCGALVLRWSYPLHREPLTDIAPRLRAALEAGVRARAEATPVLGSDLSGGLDSTTLAFYADRYARQLVTVRQDAYDATNDDVKWAALARSRMGTGDHIRMEPDAAPGTRNGIRSRTATRVRRIPPSERSDSPGHWQNGSMTEVRRSISPGSAATNSSRRRSLTCTPSSGGILFGHSGRCAACRRSPVGRPPGPSAH